MSRLCVRQCGRGATLQHSTRRGAPMWFETGLNLLATHTSPGGDGVALVPVEEESSGRVGMPRVCCSEDVSVLPAAPSTQPLHRCEVDP